MKTSLRNDKVDAMVAARAEQQAAKPGQKPGGMFAGSSGTLGCALCSARRPRSQITMLGGKIAVCKGGCEK